MNKTLMMITFSVVALSFFALDLSQSNPAVEVQPVLGEKTIESIKALQKEHQDLSPLYSVVVLPKEDQKMGGCVIQGHGALMINERVEEMSDTDRRHLIAHEASYCAQKAKEAQEEQEKEKKS